MHTLGESPGLPPQQYSTDEPSQTVSLDAVFEKAWSLHEKGKLDRAEQLYRAILQAAPNHFGTLHNLGILCFQRHQYEDAVQLTREVVRLRPELSMPHNTLGVVLRHLGRLGEAEICCREALRLQPDYAEARNNLGTILIALDRPDEAEICSRDVLRVQPGNLQALRNLNAAIFSRENLGEVAASFGWTATRHPDDDEALGAWFGVRRAICNWSNYAEDEAIARNGLGGRPTPTAAFSLLSCETTLEQQLAYARRVAASTAVPASATLPIRPPRPDARIRIGYLSANFHIHPVATCLAGVIEHHDRQRFEIIAYAFDKEDGSAMRRRLVDAFDRFVDISQLPDRDAAQLIHVDEVDLLIDLHGWTPDCRAKILAHRPAPIQASYVGYPGTTGGDFIDYIIADRFVLPPERQSLFTEQVVYLPDCFLPNDDKREIAERTPSRSECGLPEHAFVFCCFNNSWKLNPTVFHIWMRLLRAVPDSVLWLYEANSFLKANLVREAEARGVTAERLVFASWLPAHSEHLARCRLADLFLDTLPYNAHATASDALWAGLPVLTCMGRTFAGRVGASLLQAAGIPELVITSLEEYEALALRLARDATLLRGLRARLAQNRFTHRFFDTRRYTRHLEAALCRMHEIRRAGRTPETFCVPPVGQAS